MRRRRAGSTPGGRSLSPGNGAAALDAFSRAEARIEKGDYDSAWRHLHEARRYEIFGYSDTRVRVEARKLRDEVEAKLQGWRHLFALRELDDLIACKVVAKPDREVLFLAMEVRDGHHDNQYFKLRLVQKQVALLLKVLILLLLAFALLFWQKHTGLTSRGSAISPSKLVAGILVGAIGACFSGVLSLVATSPSGTIPDRIANTTVTLARPAIGAVSGLAAVLLLSAGMISSAATTILAVAFAFGFSERLAIGAVEKVGIR